MSFQVFNWKGKPIKDIHAWASERGERMVKYEARRQTPYGPEFEQGEMPESFWSSLLWNAGWSYKEIKE